MPSLAVRHELSPRRRGDTRKQGVLEKDPYAILDNMRRNIRLLITEEKKRKENNRDDETAASKQEC